MPINGKQTYYEFFGLENFEGDQKKIKKAYRSMALKWHPDRNEDKVNAERMFKQVNEINVTLCQKKDSYDRYLRNKIGGHQEREPQTSADAWSTGGARSFEYGFDIETMIRQMREEMHKKQQWEGMHKRQRANEIAQQIMTLTDGQINEVEKFIRFVKG